MELLSNLKDYSLKYDAVTLTVYFEHLREIFVIDGYHAGRLRDMHRDKGFARPLD